MKFKIKLYRKKSIVPVEVELDETEMALFCWCIRERKLMAWDEENYFKWRIKPDEQKGSHRLWAKWRDTYSVRTFRRLWGYSGWYNVTVEGK